MRGLRALVPAVAVGAALAGNAATAPQAHAADRVPYDIPIEATPEPAGPFGYMRGLMVIGDGSPAPIRLSVRGSIEIALRTCLRTTVYPRGAPRIVKTRTYPRGTVRTAQFPRVALRPMGRFALTHRTRLLARLSAHIGSCAAPAYAEAVLGVGGAE